jgi:hypothetical protein
MKIKIIVPYLLLCSVGVRAQNMFSMSSVHPADSLRNEEQEQAIRYPSLRRASVTTTVFGSGHFDAALNGTDFAGGKSQNVRISSFLSVPISKWNGNAISATIYHNKDFFNRSQVSNHLPAPRLSDNDLTRSTLGLSLNFSRIDAIFHAPVVYSVVLTGISDNLKTLRRFNFNGSVSFPLKRTPDTYLSLGALVLIDPSAPVPLIPLINYYRRLNSTGLQLILDLPQGASLKQTLSKNTWINVGISANTYASFYESDDPALPARFSYNTIEFKSGPGIEYLFGKYVILSLSGGVNKVTSARVIAKGDHYNDAFIRSTNKATPYGELRISLLPF